MARSLQLQAARLLYSVFECTRYMFWRTSAAPEYMYILSCRFSLQAKSPGQLPSATGPAIVKREAHTQGPASILCSGKLWLVLVNGVVLTGDKQRGDVRRHQSPLWVRSPQIWSLVPYMPQLPTPNLVKFHHQYKAVHHKYERAVSRSRDRVRMYDNGTWPEISRKRDLSSLPLPLPCAPASHRHGQACWSRTSSQV